jgi:pimeloyl-ACP methyl ester carboxylesterase
MKESHGEIVTRRGGRMHVRLWGPAGAPRLFLLHGWMDVAASFQFVVDSLRNEWRVIAPDWRGFGSSDWNRDAYWFPDYLADLDTLLRHYSPDEPVRLVGHSMGGNVASLYAGVRPQRVGRLALLEGFGLPAVAAGEAPARYARWLDQLAEVPGLRDYADRGQLAERLRRDNPRLTDERAAFLAAHLGMVQADGRIAMAADPYHRVVNPVLYRLEEAKACWRRVTAPVLWVVGSESTLLKNFAIHDDDYRERLACFGDLRETVIADAGHNMHHDQPERLATVLEDFLDS